MSSSSNHVKLDDDGFIDSSQFQKEVQSALESDVKYRQVDYMKKRAVKVAKSYDEFRDMVACAHLKTLTRNEVEELSTKKKGWKKGHTASAGTSLLSDDNKGTVFQNILNKSSTGGDESNQKPLPRTMMEFGRDWMRLSSSTDKEAYLLRLGRPKFKKIIAHGDDFDVLEDVCGVIVNAASSSVTSSANVSASATATQSAGADDEPIALPTTSAILDKRQWLRALSTMQQFDMLMGCVRKELAATVQSILNAPASPKVKKTVPAATAASGTATVPGEEPSLEEIHEAVSLANRVSELVVSAKTVATSLKEGTGSSAGARGGCNVPYVANPDDLD